MTCICDEKSPCLFHKEKGMSNHQNEVIAEDRMESIHYDLEQTLREARRESGMTLESIASVIAEVLDPIEREALIELLKVSLK